IDPVVPIFYGTAASHIIILIAIHLLFLFFLFMGLHASWKLSRNNSPETTYVKKYLSLKYFAIFISLAVLAGTGSAQTSIWSVNSAADISKGDAKGVSVASNGTITPAPKLDEIFATGQSYVWSAAIDASGNIYLGTG